MFTRCPACHTVHVVSAALLAAAAGRYRCAKCNTVSDALECLFDEWPAAGDRPPGPGDLPVLGLTLDLEAATRARQQPDDPAGGGSLPESAAKRRPGRLLLRAAWILAALAVLGFSAFRFAEFHGRPLFEQADLERIGLVGRPPDEPLRDLERIQLVSRELRSHPSRPGQLRLSLMVVNRADHSQPFPAIEVALLDAGGRTLSTRRFEPTDYLDPNRAADAGMTPRAYVPLTLDLDDPGEQAVGFELEFR